jgi:RNA polymerase sigma factor (sigma-70 family)
MSTTATSHENKVLIDIYKATPTVELRNVIVKLNLGLARLAARQFAEQYSDVPYQDLEQEAVFALTKSIGMFRTDGGAAFSNYVITYIRGHLKHFIRDKRSTIRIPQKILSLHEAINKLSGENLSVAEIAVLTDTSREKVIEAIRLKKVVPLEVETEAYSSVEASTYFEEQKQLPLLAIEELINKGLKNKELWDAINAIT